MITYGIHLNVNDYGLEFDSFLGALYLPWHTLAPLVIALVAYKIYKKVKVK